MERALAGNPTDDIDVVLYHPGLQEKRRVLLSGRPIIDHENKVVAGVVTIKDIAEYKKLEDKLKRSEKKLRSAIGYKKDTEPSDSSKDDENGKTD
jgi:hypothetical protein